jgi:hypothetical protein
MLTGSLPDTLGSFVYLTELCVHAAGRQRAFAVSHLSLLLSLLSPSARQEFWSEQLNGQHPSHAGQPHGLELSVRNIFLLPMLAATKFKPRVRRNTGSLVLTRSVSWLARQHSFGKSAQRHHSGIDGQSVALDTSVRIVYADMLGGSRRRHASC